MSVRSDVRKALEDKNVNIKDLKDLLEKGIMRKSCLELLYKPGPDQLQVEEIWQLLLNFHLATEIKEPPSLFIPSLIPDTNRDKFIGRPGEPGILDKIKKNQDTRGIYFSFNKSNKPYFVFNQILSQLISTNQFTTTFKKAFASKIENREVGVVAAMSGRLKWNDKGKEVVNFVVTERDHNAYDRKDQTFGRHKVSVRF